jgi:hypothetical protein
MDCGLDVGAGEDERDVAVEEPRKDDAVHVDVAVENGELDGVCVVVNELAAANLTGEEVDETDGGIASSVRELLGVAWVLKG